MNFSWTSFWSKFALAHTPPPGLAWPEKINKRGFFFANVNSSWSQRKRRRNYLINGKEYKNVFPNWQAEFLNSASSTRAQFEVWAELGLSPSFSLPFPLHPLTKLWHPFCRNKTFECTVNCTINYTKDENVILFEVWYKMFSLGVLKNVIFLLHWGSCC